MPLLSRVKLKLPCNMQLYAQKGTVGLPCLNSSLDGGRWSNACPGHFKTEEETQHPLYMRLGGPQDQLEWVWKGSLNSTGVQTLNCPAHIELPHQLCNPGPSTLEYVATILYVAVAGTNTLGESKTPKDRANKDRCLSSVLPMMTDGEMYSWSALAWSFQPDGRRHYETEYSVWWYWNDSLPHSL